MFAVWSSKGKGACVQAVGPVGERKLSNCWARLHHLTACTVYKHAGYHDTIHRTRLKCLIGRTLHKTPRNDLAIKRRDLDGLSSGSVSKHGVIGAASIALVRPACIHACIQSTVALALTALANPDDEIRVGALQKLAIVRVDELMAFIRSL